MMRMENAPLFTGGNRGGVYTFGAVLARLVHALWSFE